MNHLCARISLTIIFLCLFFAPASSSVFAQGAAGARQEQLLNGLKVILLTRAGDPQFILKLRVKSGAAFDLAGKEGTLALLSDALAPDQAAREDLAESLGGRFDVSTSYDAINITIKGRSVDFERYIELLRDALINTLLTDANVEKLRDARLQVVKQTNNSPTTIADRAIAARLYGSYVYARPSVGTPEALGRITRGDLMLARERFLNPNNSTLTLISGLDDARVMRTLRQLLGGWQRSNAVVPPSFRQPGPYDARTLIVDLPGAESIELRLAARGFAYGDRQQALAAQLLALIARERWRQALPEANEAPIFVRHDAYQLGGIFTLGATVPLALATKAMETARAVVRSLATTAPTTTEIARAKNELLAQSNKETSQSEALATLWLDRDAYHLNARDDKTALINGLTASDLKQTAAALFPDTNMASVAVGPAARLGTELERLGATEILGAGSSSVAPAAPAAPPKDEPPLTARPKPSLAPSSPRPFVLRP